MASSRGFFSPRPLNSSNGFSTTNHIGSDGHMLSIREQQTLMFQAQLHNLMVGQEHLRQHCSLAPTFSVKPSTYVHNSYPLYVATTHGMLSTMPQPYSIDGSKLTRGFAPIANPTHVGVHAEPVPTHLSVSKHASSTIIAGFDNKKLKRKFMTTEVQPGPSTDVVLESRINAIFGFNKNCQEVQMHKAKKKNTIMTPLFINENEVDDATERDAREIKFFPLSMNHGLPSSDSGFIDYEMSSMFGDASDVEMDLSLNLSSSGGESGIEVDLSLKL